MTDLEKPKMDDEYIIQNDIVDRYLKNKLTADEIIAFEEYAMDKPELLEQLELDSVLMETLPEAFEAKHQKAEESEDIKPSFWQVIFGTPVRASLSTIACCVIVTLSTYQVVISPRYSAKFTDDPVVLNPSINYVSELRSVNPDSGGIDLTFDHSSSSAVIVLQPGVHDARDYVVLINSASGELHTKVPSASLDFQGDLTLLLNLKHFSKGSYQIELLAEEHNDPVLTAQFNVN